MRFTGQHAALIGVAVVCAAAGAGVSAIANAGASRGAAARPVATAGASRGTAARPAFGHARAGRLGAHFGVRRLLRRAVHGQIVVATRMGFRTITFDRGSVQSVNGRQLTLQDGDKRATYRTITLMIPTAARVRDDGQLASLGDVKPGQRALVIQAPMRTLVIARTP